MKRYLLEFTVFVCGAVVMVLELTGSRVLAPYVGTSLHVWTSLIGIILGSLSVGYWSGGKIADTYPTYKAYAGVIFLSGCAILFTAIVKDPILGQLQTTIPNVSANAILATILLFAPASILLGMVSPYAVKLRMQELASSGATVGRLYAISTIGSIVGTFGAGFWLMGHLGSRSIIYLLAAILIALSLLVSSRELVRIKIGVGLLLLIAFGWSSYTQAADEKRGYIERDTAYSHVVILDTKDPYSGQPVRLLTTSVEAVQSGMFLHDPTTLVFPYTKYYRLAEHFRPDAQIALMIGGGAFSYPKDFLKTFPEARMDVVEIDPGITALAKEYFYLPNDPRLTILHEDGRTFINRTEKKYDVIFIDAFQSLTPPFHLMTVEATQHLYDMLNPNGVIFVNVVSSLEGDTGNMFQAAYRTYSSVFPHVYALPVHYTDRPEAPQNIMLIAEKAAKGNDLQFNNPEFASYFSHLWQKDPAQDVPILTDEFAPVEQYMMGIK